MRGHYFIKPCDEAGTEEPEVVDGEGEGDAEEGSAHANTLMNISQAEATGSGEKACLAKAEKGGASLSLRSNTVLYL